MKLRAFKLDPFEGRYTASTRNEKHTYIVEAFGSDGRCEVFHHDEERMASERIGSGATPENAIALARLHAISL